MRLTPGVLTLH